MKKSSAFSSFGMLIWGGTISIVLKTSPQSSFLPQQCVCESTWHGNQLTGPIHWVRQRMSLLPHLKLLPPQDLQDWDPRNFRRHSLRHERLSTLWSTDVPFKSLEVHFVSWGKNIESTFLQEFHDIVRSSPFSNEFGSSGFWNRSTKGPYEFVNVKRFSSHSTIELAFLSQLSIMDVPMESLDYAFQVAGLIFKFLNSKLQMQNWKRYQLFLSNHQHGCIVSSGSMSSAVVSPHHFI